MADSRIIKLTDDLVARGSDVGAAREGARMQIAELESAGLTVLNLSSGPDHEPLGRVIAIANGSNYSRIPNVEPGDYAWEDDGGDPYRWQSLVEAALQVGETAPRVYLPLPNRSDIDADASP